jgi:hypothetical protein
MKPGTTFAVDEGSVAPLGSVRAFAAVAAPCDAIKGAKPSAHKHSTATACLIDNPSLV